MNEEFLLDSSPCIRISQSGGATHMLNEVGDGWVEGRVMKFHADFYEGTSSFLSDSCHVLFFSSETLVPPCLVKVPRHERSRK